MPDLLSHVLFAYACGTMLSVRYDWLTPQWVTALMAGALVPDVDKISLFVSDPLMERVLGMPFSWEVIHVPIGAIMLCGLGGLAVAAPHRRRAVTLLVIGAMSHLALDQLAIFTTGYSYPLLWPLTTYHFPAGDLYQSSDRLPVLITAGLAVVAYRFSSHRPERTRND
jgi:hypothetical protein